MTRNFRLFSNATLLAGAILAVTLFAAPPARAVKADELVKITSATIDPPLAAGGDKISVFGGDLKFEVPLKAGADFAPKPGDAITVTIDYQGCNNNECLRPASVSTTVALAAPGAAAGALEGIAAGGGVTRGGIRGGGDDSDGALEHIFLNHGWFLGFLAGFLGGLGLNLA